MSNVPLGLRSSRPIQAQRVRRRFRGKRLGRLAGSSSPEELLFSTDMEIRDPFISVVIPVLDEADSIESLSQELVTVLVRYSQWEVIFVDDGSRDRTDEVVQRLLEIDPRFRLLKLSRNFGKADALAEGFLVADGDIVITMDGDLQDDPAEIPNLVAKLGEGWDVVSGWKKDRQDPLSKRLPSRLWNVIVRALTGIPIHDFNCGLKAYRAPVVKSIDLYGGLHRYIPALAKQKGFTVTEVPVNHRPRIHGVSSYRSARFFHGFFDLLTVVFLGRFFSRPLHLFGPVGLVLSLVGLGINGWLTVGWFQGRYIGDRPLFFLGILLLIVGVQFFSIGLLGEMVIKTTRRSEKRLRSITKTD